MKPLLVATWLGLLVAVTAADGNPIGQIVQVVINATHPFN